MTRLNAMVISRMKRANAATASGAMVIERFSHSSRRIDQYMRSFAGLIGGAATRDVRGEPGGTFDGVFMRPPLWLRRPP